MTYEEAIREAELEFGYSRDMDENPERQDELLQLIVESLKKQTPIKSKYMSYEDIDGRWDGKSCPLCHSMCGHIKDKYCPECGQALK